MTIYAVAPPGDHAETIMRWSIFEAKCGYLEERTRHLVGYMPSTRHGRSSTPIKEFDREKMQITTSSGRIYQLAGCPGYNDDADYIWKYYQKINDISDIIDVTNEYYTYKIRTDQDNTGNNELTRKDLEESVPVVNREVCALDIPEPYATEFSKYCIGRAKPAEPGKFWATDWQRWLATRFKHR